MIFPFKLNKHIFITLIACEIFENIQLNETYIKY